MSGIICLWQTVGICAVTPAISDCPTIRRQAINVRSVARSCTFTITRSIKMADPALQLLLDPAPSQGSGIIIRRRVDDALGTTTSYWCDGQVTGVGKAMWVNVVTANSDAAKNTAIRAAFGVA